MAERESVRLRRLAAELRADARRVDRTVTEAKDAEVALAHEPSRLAIYGTAALLETFYSGVEKMLWRIALTFDDVPSGPAWHRQLLEGTVLDMPKVRPPVLEEETVARLETFLAFRHRFRNLYLFDLQQDLIQGLVTELPDVWRSARQELEDFAALLDRLADAVDSGEAPPSS